jgi:hypothetical protein
MKKTLDDCSSGLLLYMAVKDCIKSKRGKMKRKEESLGAEKKPRTKRAKKQAVERPVPHQGILFSARDLAGSQLGLFGDDKLISITNICPNDGPVAPGGNGVGDTPAIGRDQASPQAGARSMGMKLTGNQNYSEIVGKIARRWGLGDADTRKILDDMMSWSSRYAEEIEEITHAGIGADNARWVASKPDDEEVFVWFSTDGGDSQESNLDDDMASIMGIEWEDFREALSGYEL